MASETRIIPDLYFPDEDQELQISSVEGEGGLDPQVEIKRKEPVDLTPDGFIPIHKLTLEDLPEPIRTEKHLKLILTLSKRVVKINNNRLSDRRPDDDDFKMNGYKSMTGSGYLSKLHGNIVLITTNRHVLFDEEELRTSTFDVCSHCHGTPGNKDAYKRSGRKHGKYFFAKYSKNDIAIGVYDVVDRMVAYIKEHCLEGEEIQPHLELSPDLAGDPNSSDVACLISHPLGQPKHVSFGEMVDYNLQSGIVHHTAPSKPGSSGGLVIVFSRSFLQFRIFHVGTRLKSKKKHAIMQSFEVSPLDMHDRFQALQSEIDQMPREEAINPEMEVQAKNPEEEVQGEIASEDGTKLETNIFKEVAPELPSEANASIIVAYLAALIPVFGAFHLHVRETPATELDTNTLKPCKTFPSGDFLTSDTLKKSFKEAVQKLAQVAPNFAMCSLSNLDTSDLVSLLESQGPCYCQSIVKMMERGVKLEDGTVTECFLSPYTAAAKMFSDGDVTWPWLNGNNTEINHDSDTVDCLTEICLKLWDRGFIPAMLFLMITKANIAVKELSFESEDALSASTSTSADQECQWETIYERTTMIHPSNKNKKESPVKVPESHPPAREEKLHSSAAEEEKNLHSLREEGLLFLNSLLGSALPKMTTRLMNEQQTTGSLEKEKEELKMLYTRGLTWLQQAQPYLQQAHSDAESDDGHQEGSDGKWCRCGQSTRDNTEMAHTDLGSFMQPQMAGNSQGFDPNIFGFGEIAQRLLNSGATGMGMNSMDLLQTLQHFAPNQGIPQDNKSNATSSTSTSAPIDDDLRGETLPARTAQTNSSEKTQEKVSSRKEKACPLEKRKLNSSASAEKSDWHTLVADILSFIFPVLRLLTEIPSLRLSKEHDEGISHQEESEGVDMLYSICLAVSEHSSQHERQIHPDKKRLANRSGDWCHCGRPGMQEVTLAYTGLVQSTLGQIEESDHSFSQKLRKDEAIMLQLQEKNSVGMGMAFIVFVTAIQMTASQQSLDPGAALLIALDEMEAFPYGCDSLILFMASAEVFLRNLCLLAKHISRLFRPRYFAFPVSVFGRPGDWPGNVTPPEVQRTAWRLIQDAIMASGFGPAVLAALEKDEERREKLIDLYVDMKQLKWQGRIQPRLFGRYLASSRKNVMNHVQGALPFENHTHYFVWYTAYLVRPQMPASRGSNPSQCSVL